MPTAGEGDGDLGASPASVRRCRGTAVRLRDRAHDREAQPGATRSLGSLRGIAREGLEGSIDEVRAEARARIGHLEADPCIGYLGRRNRE